MLSEMFMKLWESGAFQKAIWETIYMTLTATAFAKGVEISLGDIPVYLSDNYIDITSAAPVKVTMTVGSLETVERVRSMLKVRSVYDIK